MPKGFEVIGGSVTNQVAFTAWNVNTGNSLTVRSADVNSKVKLLTAWGLNATVGGLRIRSPRLHDFQQGIRMRVSPANPTPLLGATSDDLFQQPLVPQDTLTVEQFGGGAEVDSGAMLVYYDSLPGIAARLVSPDDVNKFGVNIIGQEVSVTTVANGNWSGQVAINSLAGTDNFKANTDYALLGAQVDTQVTTVRVQGVDTGNLGVGIPGHLAERGIFNNWFMHLSRSTGLALVPVFNSANKFGILVDAQANTAVTTLITLYLVEMQSGSIPGATQVKLS